MEMTNKLKVKVVYFAYLHQDIWEPIVMEQLNSLKQTDLYERSDEIYISLVCNKDKFSHIQEIIKENFNKIKVINRFYGNHFEYPGIKSIYDLSLVDDESLILYFHTKGMTSQKNYPRNIKIRSKLFEHTVSNSKIYIDEFEKNPNLDIGGCFISENSFSWYNFFWVRSSYVKNFLPKPEPQENRFYWEKWIGSDYSTKENIITFSPALGYEKLKNKSHLYRIRNSLFGQI